MNNEAQQSKKPNSSSTKNTAAVGGVQAPALAVQGISKEFSGVRVLNDITLEVRKGEIMGLIGENGAGKSTLIKIVSGIYQPSSGSIRIDGKPVRIDDYIAAKKLGIAIVPQEFNLINTLTVYENIFLGNEICLPSGLLDKKRMKAAAAEQLSRLQMPVPVDRLVSDLSVAEKQMVEISKALLLKASILIMDEPTTTLTGRETNTLFALMEELQNQGVTMIFVSHKLGEIKRLCNRITVLRDGDLIDVVETSQVNEEDIARKMIGRDFHQAFPPKRQRAARQDSAAKPEGAARQDGAAQAAGAAQDSAAPALEVRNLNIHGLLKDISFTLGKGEILGFAGLVGSGRTETAEAVMGLRRIDSGTVLVDGEAVRIDSPRDAVRHGLGYLSEDRQGRGIVQSFSIPRNITLISLKRYVSRFLVDFSKEAKKSAEYIKLFNIVAASQSMALRYLSGGNQQKVYLARWVDTNPRILILDEPTRGIDVNAKREIYDFIHRLADQGISCIVISSEMEEVIGLCDRVYVMRGGSISGCLAGERVTEEEIMFYAAGIKGKVD